MKLDEKGNIVEPIKEEETQLEENTDAEESVENEETQTDTDKNKALDIDNKIDYKVEMEKLREAKEKAEKALAEKRFKNAEYKRKVEENEEEINEEDKPLTAKELQSILVQERQLILKESNSTRIRELANKYAAGDIDHANYIVELYNSRQFPTDMALEEQVEEAYILANKKRIIGENNELKRALVNKGNTNTFSASSVSDKMKGDEPQISSASKKAITYAGYKYNSASRRYEKKLANGQTLIWDYKEKQTRLV